MKTTILIVTFLFTACFSGPCDDSLYIELRKKELNELTKNELYYYLEKDRFCVESGGEAIEEWKKKEYDAMVRIKNEEAKRFTKRMIILNSIFTACMLSITIMVNASK